MWPFGTWYESVITSNRSEEELDPQAAGGLRKGLTATAEYAERVAVSARALPLDNRANEPRQRQSDENVERVRAKGVGHRHVAEALLGDDDGREQIRQRRARRGERQAHDVLLDFEDATHRLSRVHHELSEECEPEHGDDHCRRVPAGVPAPANVDGHH